MGKTSEQDSCLGKECYQTRELAVRVLKRRNKSKNKRMVHAYKCRFCGGWHHGAALLKGV